MGKSTVQVSADASLTSSLSAEERVVASDLLAVLDSVNVVKDIKAFSLKKSFFEIGGDSLNATTVAVRLKKKGYNISIDDFIECGSLEETIKVLCRQQNNQTAKKKSQYRVRSMEKDDLDKAIKILGYGFYTKSEIVTPLENKNYQDWEDATRSITEAAFPHGLCTVSVDGTNTIVGANVNFDLEHEEAIPYHVIFTGWMGYLGEVVDAFEAPIRN